MVAPPKKILVAPAWPYAAGHRHLGHVAGFGVPSDVFARYHRLRGNDVLMVSGTDEHGTPVMVAAIEKGRSSGEVADYYNQSFREDFQRLGLSYDLFSRTTTLNHERVIQDLFRTLYEHGAIVEQEMLVSFSSVTGHTLPDRYIEGDLSDLWVSRGARRPVRQLRQPTRPHGLDQPEVADRRHDTRVSRDEASLPRPAAVRRPAEGMDRLATTTGGRTSATSRSRLLDEIRPRPITRDLDWGVRIPVPGYAEDENKRIYVWFDAVIGYLSASIEWAATSATPTPGVTGGRTRTPSTTTSRARTTSSSTP